MKMVGGCSSTQFELGGCFLAEYELSQRDGIFEVSKTESLARSLAS
jgi:hypothetical protein